MCHELTGQVQAPITAIVDRYNPTVTDLTYAAQKGDEVAGALARVRANLETLQYAFSNTGFLLEAALGAASEAQTVSGVAKPELLQGINELFVATQGMARMFGEAATPMRNDPVNGTHLKNLAEHAVAPLTRIAGAPEYLRQETQIAGANAIQYYEAVQGGAL